MVPRPRIASPCLTAYQARLPHQKKRRPRLAGPVATPTYGPVSARVAPPTHQPTAVGDGNVRDHEKNRLLAVMHCFWHCFDG
jgi:hypothetical protein